MIQSLTYEQWILGFSLSMPRFLAAFSLLPFFSTQVVPGMLRQGVAASLCLILVPYTAEQAAAVQITGVTLLVIVVKEVIVGLLIGYPLAALFWAVEGIGFYVDNQRGSAMASSADPLTGSESTPLGILFTQAFTVYFMSSGAFLLMLGVFYQTYQIWPVPEFFPALGGAGPVFYLDIFDRLLRMIVVLSAPLIVAMFLAEFALALVSRFAPQLQVFFLAMPIKSGLSILLLIFYGPILFGDLMTYDGGLDAVWSAIREVLRK
ncbi:MAG TPA: type III secretion system export apparatus subunit SctT [Reyranella sp.]|nr:type III secretion system export apparatus subunit SctT [Reyranella sp.]